MNTNSKSKNIGRLYLKGLATYLKFRLLDAGHALARLLLWPWQYAARQARRVRFSLKPWLRQHRRQLAWSLPLLLFAGPLGGVGLLYLWRKEIAALVSGLKKWLGRHRTTIVWLMAGLVLATLALIGLRRRDALAGLARNIWRRVAIGQPAAQPSVVVIATAPAEEVSAEPSFNGRER